MTDGAPLRVEEIVEQGLCAGCGLCQSLAGAEQVEMVMTRAGFLRPRVNRPLDDALLRLIEETCPGVHMTGLPPSARSSDGQLDPIWGHWLRFGRAHAVDPDVRYRGSSGGVLTALAAWMLETGRVERIVHVAMSAERPLRSTAHVSADRADVERAAGSRYGPAAPLVELAAVLDAGVRFALIGKPCDIAAARNLARHDARLDRACAAFVSFVCGGVPSLTKTEEALESWGLGEDEVALCRHRGHGCPGMHHVETHDGRVFEVHSTRLWDDFTDWRLQQRCKVCPDAIGEGADVVVSDAWEGGAPSGEYEGHCGLIVRTDVGRALVDEAVGGGVIAFDRAWGPRDFDVIQPYHARLKQVVGARHEGLRLAGQRAPRTRDLRVEALAQSCAAELRREARDGLLARARAGRTVEPPVPPREA